MNFCCFDVETTNESASSICQIEIAAFIEGRHEPTQCAIIPPPTTLQSRHLNRRDLDWQSDRVLEVGPGFCELAQKEHCRQFDLIPALSVSVEFEAVLDIRTSATIEAKLPSRATALVLGAG